MQARLPYWNGMNASFTQLSLPRSVPIHRSGMNELGFEKKDSLCSKVHIGQLTTVYWGELQYGDGRTFPAIKRPAIIMPSGGVTRGAGRPPATGRIRRALINIEGRGSYLRILQHPDRQMLRLIDQWSVPDCQILSGFHQKVVQRFWDWRRYNTSRTSMTMPLYRQRLLYR